MSKEVNAIVLIDGGYTIPRLAKYLGISRQKCYYYVKIGAIPHTRGVKNSIFVPHLALFKDCPFDEFHSRATPFSWVLKQIDKFLDNRRGKVKENRRKTRIESKKQREMEEQRIVSQKIKDLKFQ